VDALKSYVGVARRFGEIVLLSELVRRHVLGRSTAGLVALTFDDAYVALRTEALQFLAAESIPIAIFIVTKAAATGAAYWWDRIDDVYPHVEPGRWREFERACGVPEDYRQKQPRGFGPLRPLRQWLLAAYAGRWPAHLEEALAALEEGAAVRTHHRSMTFDEVAELAVLTPVEVGVHTLSHPVLPLLSVDALKKEIAGSYAVLRERFASPLPILSIPFGLYDRRTLRAAASFGMIGSLTLGGTLLDTRRQDQALSRLCLNRGDSAARLGLRLLGVPDLIRRCLGRPVDVYPALPSAAT
jgi:peptidoglycan/xylan/chitin deacetylase (PgdA/CDA1 family)